MATAVAVAVIFSGGRSSITLLHIIYIFLFSHFYFVLAASHIFFFLSSLHIVVVCYSPPLRLSRSLSLPFFFLPALHSELQTFFSFSSCLALSLINFSYTFIFYSIIWDFNFFFCNASCRVYNDGADGGRKTKESKRSGECEKTQPSSVWHSTNICIYASVCIRGLYATCVCIRVQWGVLYVYAAAATVCYLLCFYTIFINIYLRILQIGS